MSDRYADLNVFLSNMKPLCTHARTQTHAHTGAAALGTALLGPNIALAGGIDAKPDIDWYQPVSVTDQQYSGEEWTGPVWAAPEGEM